MLPQDVEIEAGILQLGNNDISLPPNQETTITKIFSANQIIDSINIDPPNGSSNLKIGSGKKSTTKSSGNKSTGSGVVKAGGVNY